MEMSQRFIRAELEPEALRLRGLEVTAHNHGALLRPLTTVRSSRHVPGDFASSASFWRSRVATPRQDTPWRQGDGQKVCLLGYFNRDLHAESSADGNHLRMFRGAIAMQKPEPDEPAPEAFGLHNTQPLESILCQIWLYGIRRKHLSSSSRSSAARVVSVRMSRTV